MTEPDLTSDADRWRLVDVPGRTEISYLAEDERRPVFSGEVQPPAPLPERAVAVVRNGTRLLVIRRRRDGRKYCVLPGGGVEPGEQPSTAVLRELAEETGLRGTVREPLYRDEQDRPATYFLVDVQDPDAELVLGGPEQERARRGNSYRPGWIELSELDRHNLQPARLRPLLRGLS